MVHARRVKQLAVGVLAACAIAAIATSVRAGPARDSEPARTLPPRDTLNATPSTLATVFAHADGGDTIVLASGDYGTFRGAIKVGMVTLEPAPGATVTMAVEFNPAANITLNGLRVTSLEIADSRSHDVTVRNSRFDAAQAVIRTGDLSNARILLDHNSHVGFDKCTKCYEGRVELVGRTVSPSGVTISNSSFSGGNSDGIQNGGYGVRIIDNRFTDIHQVDGADGVHADAIQLYGSKGTVIRGNTMRDVADGIMAPDGTDHEVIEHNFIQTDGYPYAVTLGGDRGSVIRANRLPGGACHYHLSCGTLRIARGNDGRSSRGTVVQGNVLGALAVEHGSRLGPSGDNAVGR
jgi:hypothetical protein